MTTSGVYVRVSSFLWVDRLPNGLAGMQTPPRMCGDLKPPKTATALPLSRAPRTRARTYLTDRALRQVKGDP